MAVVNASCVSFTPRSSASPMLLSSNFTTFPSNFSSSATVKGRVFLDSQSAINNKSSVCETVESTGTQLYSFSPLPSLVLTALPGAATVTSVFEPFVELVKSWNILDWLIHWVTLVTWLLCCLPWEDMGHTWVFVFVSQTMQKKKLRPKLCILNFLEERSSLLLELLVESRLFSLQINHFLKGLTLLTVQTILPALFEPFEGNPGSCNVRGILGSGIVTLFLVHAALGLQLGLSY